MVDRSGSAVRSGVVWAGVTALAAAVVVAAMPALTDTTTEAPGQRFDHLLVAVCAGFAVLTVGGLWLATGVVVIAALRGCPDRVRGVPAPLRRLLLGACGVALASGLTPTLGAADATPGSPHEDSARPSITVAGLPLPDRAIGVRAVPRFLTVRPGDSLWAIAGRDLDPGATTAEIDAHWRELYRLNRALIGPDPDLIHPGQRIRLPRG